MSVGLEWLMVMEDWSRADGDVNISVAMFHTEKYQPLLQLSSSDLSQLRQMVPALHVSYLLHCADLCEDFSEDLQFHFSLGLNTFLVPSLSPLYTVPCTHLARLWLMLVHG